MNLTQSSVVLRPRSVSEVMDLACLWAGSRALGMNLRLSGVALLPVFVLVMTCRYLLDWNAGALWLLAFALVTPLQGVFTIAAGRMLFSEKLTVRQVLQLYAKRLRSYLGSLFISRLYMAMGASLILLLPVVGTRMLFSHEASLLEMAAASESTKRSTRLVASRTSGAFQAWCSLLLAQLGIIGAAELLGQGLIDGLLQLGQPFGSIGNNFFSPYALLGLLASVPYVAIARYLFYIDTRTRADGWDIQVRFFAVAAEHEQSRITP